MHIYTRYEFTLFCFIAYYQLSNIERNGMSEANSVPACFFQNGISAYPGASRFSGFVWLGFG